MGLQREVIEYSRGKVFAEAEFISHVLLNWIVTTRRLGTCYLFICCLCFLLLLGLLLKLTLLKS